MEEHEVKTVSLKESTSFKNVKLSYDASYMYCDIADELYGSEEQIRENDIKIKNAYRKKMGLLTSSDISSIRSKYSISQVDLCKLLGWGEKTIARYETHQVQDKAHDYILKKIDEDPEWFIILLEEAKPHFANSTFLKYFQCASSLYETKQDLYLRKTIEASYSKYQVDKLANGNTALSLDKIVDVIKYFASSSKVTNLYKVKLMKLLWYADALSYKKNGHAITGLVYQALTMGAVPIGHNFITDLKDVPCEEEEIGETSAYHFSLKENPAFPSLNDTDIKILDTVSQKLGKMSKSEIVDFMHNEEAYKHTKPRDVISFKYAKALQI